MSTTEGMAREQDADRQRRARLDRLTRADERLEDAYPAGAITLAELSARRAHLSLQRRALEQQDEQQQRVREQRAKAEEVLGSFEAFAARIQSRLAEASFEDKQAILPLVIERVIVGEDTLEVQHVIPLRSAVPDPGGHPPPGIPLCSDGVHITALPGRGRATPRESLCATRYGRR